MKKKILKRIGRIAGAALLVILIILAVIILRKRPALQSIAEYQAMYPGCVLSGTQDGCVVLKPAKGSEDRHTGFIFYCGAQIEPEAYIPLMARLSESGYTCFIPKLLFNMASFEPGAAGDIINAHGEIDNWIIGGHSMGAYTAAGCIADHPDLFSGIVFLASYSGRDLSGSAIPFLSVYGDQDGVLNRDNYQKFLAQQPQDFEEYVIPGANHAQYGDYGLQPRDLEASITMEEQQAQTAQIILNWLERHSL